MKLSEVKLSLNAAQFHRKILKLFISTLVVSAAVIFIISVSTDKLLSEFSLFVLQDVAVIVNICFAIYLSALIANDISGVLNSEKDKLSDTPFALMTLLWGRILSGALSFIPYFLVSSLTFIVVKYIYFASLKLEFLQILFLSYLSFFPIAGISICFAVLIRNRVLFYLLISFYIFSAIAFSSEIPAILKILLPDLDFYQVNTFLLHGRYGSWLYIFSLFGLGLLWVAVLSTFSSLVYDTYTILKRKNHLSRAKILILLTECFVIFVSAFFLFYISHGLKSIETEKTEKTSGFAIVPRTGFKGLWADFNFILFCELPNRQNLSYKNKDDIKKVYLRCFVNKPSFESLSKNAPFIFANINFVSQKETNKLVFESINNYMRNPYLRREPLFEINASTLLTSPSNSEREKYLYSVSELLRQTEQIASAEHKEIIAKQIVSLNTELIQAESWKNDMLPLNRDFAELLVWYREWKRALANNTAQVSHDVKTIEKNLIIAADKAENSSMGNQNIISSIKEIRKKVYMAKYISSDKLPYFY